MWRTGKSIRLARADLAEPEFIIASVSAVSAAKEAADEGGYRALSIPVYFVVRDESNVFYKIMLRLDWIVARSSVTTMDAEFGQMTEDPQ